MLDLLGGMRKQGLRYAKSSTPAQASDMLHVMALAKPFSADRLAGFDDACVLAGGDGGKGAASHVADVMRKADKYCLRGLSELARLRLEAGAPVSRDMTRREAEVRQLRFGRVASLKKMFWSDLLIYIPTKHPKPRFWIVLHMHALFLRPIVLVKPLRI